VTGPRILTIDIETSPHIAAVFGRFKQDISMKQILEESRVICFAAKWHGSKKVIFRSTFHDGREAMVQEAWDLMDQADVLVHFNGRRFDIPRLNTEYTLGNLPEPAPSLDVDLLQVVRRRFGFASNKLDDVLWALGLGRKVAHSGIDLWLRCREDDPKAWALMKKYCIGDTVKEEKLYDRVLPWIKGHPNVALFTGDTAGCRWCGSTDLVRRGFAHTSTSSYQRYRCSNCNAWSRGAKAVTRTDLRGIA
jgi:DNA polymerase elongation subunit (family B)